MVFGLTCLTFSSIQCISFALWATLHDLLYFIHLIIKELHPSFMKLNKQSNTIEFIQIKQILYD